MTTTQSRLIVLKFGSSVLRSAADLPVAVHAIYSELRERRRIVAVVSAFAGVTDTLLAEARQLGLTGHALADHVGKGEQRTAHELAQVLNVAGVPARVADPRDFAFRAQGDVLDA